jgi:hypothetical protein
VLVGYYYFEVQDAVVRIAAKQQRCNLWYRPWFDYELLLCSRQVLENNLTDLRAHAYLCNSV